MTPRQHLREKFGRAARAAVAADSWIGAPVRQHALRRDLRAFPLDAAMQSRLLAVPRVARKLPNLVPKLLPAFASHAELAPWLASPQMLFACCRMTGAVVYGANLAKVVDGASIARLVAYLGPEVWRFAVAHKVSPQIVDIDREDLPSEIFEAGSRALHAHLNIAVPDLVDAIATASNLDWGSTASLMTTGPMTTSSVGDPDIEAAALRVVLQHGRP